jgi:predicted ester cyclase
MTTDMKSMTTDMKSMVERIPLEVLNSGNFGLIDELMAPDFVEHFPQPGVPPTREGFKQFAISLKTAFPDLHYVIEDSLEIGDRIVHRLTASGTMKGEFMGVPATGKRATWTEIHIGRVANGRLTEHWALIDQLGMLVQLGIVPAPGRVAVTV